MVRSFIKTAPTHILLSCAAVATMAGCTPKDIEPEVASETAFDANALWLEIRADIELFYAYLERDDFDSVAYLDRLEARLENMDTIAEFRAELHRATFAFTDPHFIVGPFTGDDFNIIPTSSDLIIRGADFRVIDVRAGSAADAAGVRPGWRLLRSNGVELNTQINEVFDGLLPQITDTQRDYAATLIANGCRGRDRLLDFATGSGEIMSLTLPSPRDFARTVSDSPPLEVDYPEENIVRLRINNRLGDNDMVAALDDVFAALPDVDGFILDLRNTPSGGNTTVAQALMGHFIETEKPYQIHDYPSMEREFTVPRRSVEHVLPREPYLDVPLVVLGGHWTGSMGEGIVIGLDAAADAHIIASDMGDLLGGLSNFTYADGQVKVDMGTYTLSHMDGTPREDFIADKPLSSSDRDADGNDPALTAALAWFNAQATSSPQ